MTGKSTKQVLALVFFASFANVFCGSAYADTPYWRLSTERMTVIADSSAKRCASLAKQFISYERIIKDLANIDAETEFPPLAVYSLSESDSKTVFLTEEDRKKQRAQDMRIFSKFLPGQSLNIAAIVDVSGDEPLQSVLLLYGERMMALGSTRRYPPWFQIGIANITNGLLIRDDGSALLNRNVLFEPVVDKEKGAGAKFDLAKLLSTSGNNLNTGTDWKEFSKRAREWSQFGLLTTPERKAKFHELAVLMRQGTPAAEAISQAFGVSLEQLAAEFEDGKWHKQIEYKIPAPQALPSLPACERVDPEKSKELLGVVADRVANSSGLH